MKKKVLRFIVGGVDGLIGWMIVRPYLVFRLIRFKQYRAMPSYYPEKKRKSALRIFAEQFWHILKYKALEEFYFAYGLDIKGAKLNEYVDYREFMKWRDRLNRPVNKAFEYTGILRDKFVFNLFISGLGFPSSPNIGLISNGEIFVLAEKRSMSLESYLNQNKVDAFCKAIDAEDGKSIYALKHEGEQLTVNDRVVSYKEVENLFSTNKWTIEQRIIQHAAYAEYYPKAVNTLRIYTVRDVRTGEIIFLPSIFRIGAKGNNVDNWARGGLIVRLYEDGTLGKYGYYRPLYGTKTTVHPDTGIVFEGRLLPWAKEAFALVKKMHTFLYGIHSIGWDIAVTPEGPVIIEANDNWELSATQIPSHGCRKEFNMYFKGEESLDY